MRGLFIFDLVLVILKTDFIFLDTYTSMKKQLTLNLKSAESSFLSLDLKQHGKVFSHTYYLSAFLF